MAALAERDEAIAQQAAASEVFQIINASEGDLAPVFEAIVERAMRLCGAPSGGMWLLNGDRARAVGARNLPVAYLEFLNREPVSPLQVFGRTVQGRPFLHITDLSATEAYRNRVPLTVASVELGSIRTYLGVPLREGGAVVGIINLFRQEVRPFTERQIALVQSFAIQAEIAMMNARHINETREALARQTATAEILRVISQSPTDARPVFDKILDACQRLFGSEQIGVFTIEDEMVRVAAWRGPRPEEALRDVTPFAESITGRVIRERRIHHIPDTRNIPNLSKMRRDNVDRFGGESLLYAPMLWEERGLGSILVARPAPKPFSDKEQALLQSFADQAAIAIQNARLFNETQARTRDLAEALQQQTATSDVLKVISRAAFDLQSVLDTLASSAAALCGASNGLIYLQSGDTFELKAATKSWNPETFRLLSETPQRPGRRTVGARVLLTGEVQNVADMQVDPDYDPAIRALSASRALLGVPLKRGDAIIGAFVLSRREAGAYSQRQVQIVQTFADQAVIAIENARLFDEVQARTRDLEEALQQQTATANVLKVISRSAFDLQAVFDALISSAVNLIGSQQGTIYVRDGDDFRIRAHYGVTPEFVEFLISNTPTPGMGSASGRVMLTGKVVAIPDILEDEDYALPANALNRTRSMLAAPLLRDDRVEGVLIIARTEPGAFSPRQIELVQTFADQAGIAIENARLFDEVQARTRDLEEALQQQTATADVLKVISRSAFDLQAVFETLLSSAIALSGAWQGTICIRDGDGFTYRAVSTAVGTEEFDEKIRENLLNLQGKADRTTLAGRAILSGQVEQIEDIFEDPEYWLQGSAAEAAGIRAVLGVPLLRDDRPEGALVLSRRQPGRFAPRVVELVRSFADQAVIAIENVRLFDEVQARTRDLEEALEQKTASAEILRVISSSPTDVRPVFETILRTARKLCDAERAIVHILRDGAYHAVAADGRRETGNDESLADHPILPGRGSITGRVVQERRVVHIHDVKADPEFTYLREAGFEFRRTMLGVPLLREGQVIGVIVLQRSVVQPFTTTHIDLVTTFADQAMIAVENVRLFDEVQAKSRDLEEALQQQTATSDVLKVISRSAFDLDAVLNSLTKSAVELCNSTYGVISLYRDGVLKFMAQTGCTPEFAELLWNNPAPLDRKSTTGRAGLLRTVVLVPDVTQDEEYDYHGGEIIGNYRSMMGVPLLRNGELEGVFTLMRRDPGTFTPRQIELVQTFADQAVIAIENARLFDEVQAKTRDLEEALQLQTATSEVLKVISRSAFDLQAVFDTLTASAVELCGAFSGSICVRDGDVYRYRGNAGPGLSVAMSQYLAEHPATPGRGSIVGRVLLLGKVAEIPDVLEDADYVVPLGAHGQVSRALLGVPLLGKDGIEGGLVLTRKEPGHFTPRQIEIVQTFADQAVIAIENVRLFDEVQARTKELAASLDDLRRAQDRLIQSEKLASLGQLTAGIAHEIKNPLNFVNNYSTLSRELTDELAEALARAPLEDPQRREAEALMRMIGANLDKVVHHGKRADSIVKNMLLHSREGSGERSSVNVNAMVEESLNLAYHGARAEKPGFNVTIAKSLDPQAGDADLYPQEMTRVLLNLISNGFYATTMRKRGEESGTYEPTISASTRDAGDRVEIVIRDNGTGIPDEVKTKMFNPFFTTKPAGEGTGLGLSLSHDIVVKQHGGTLDVSTEPGSHTQFTIVLPRAPQGAPAKAGASA